MQTANFTAHRRCSGHGVVIVFTAAFAASAWANDIEDDWRR